MATALNLQAIDPRLAAKQLQELWSPRVIGALDNNYLKVAKVQGVFGWHSHADQDELFYVLEGELTIAMEAGSVSIPAGQCFVVPKGVRHNPSAEQPCLILLIERKDTLHTGESVSKKTRSIEAQLQGYA